MAQKAPLGVEDIHVLEEEAKVPDEELDRNRNVATAGTGM